MDQGLNKRTLGIRVNEMTALLKERGYITFPFLPAATIAQLSDYYFNFQKETPTYFYSSTHSKDFAFRLQTSEFIKELIEPLLPVELSSYRLLGGAFVVKPPHGKGLLPPHQDWNIVDEDKFRSFNLWIPLIDVTVANGAVYVLPGSHNKLKTFRGPGLPSLFKNIEQEVWKALEPLPMKAGEALFYDHALLHASPVNGSDTIRLGIVCGMIPQDAEMQLCFAKENEVEIYSADEHFFMEKDPMQGPQGLRLVKRASMQIAALTVEEFNTIYLKPLATKKKSWIAKIFGKQ